MKKANYTLFQSRSWIVLSLILVCACFSSLTVNAQAVVEMPNNTPASLTSCTDDVNAYNFRDDGGIDGLYADDAARLDTATFCPTNQWGRVKVVFTEFDLAEGDTLFAFQGNVDALNQSTLDAAIAAGLLVGRDSSLAGLRDTLAKNPALAGLFLGQIDGIRQASVGTGSGSGAGSGAGLGATSVASARSVSDAFGGWINASCIPAVNPSGCLTFVFATNGDRAKGTGWDAWVNCEARDIEIQAADIDDVRLTCGTDAFATVTINSPLVLACSDTLDTPYDSVLVTIYNQAGASKTRILASAKNAIAANKQWTTTFGIGTYRVTFDLLSDQHPDKQVTKFFSVIGPSMACNDEVSTVFGAACQLVISSDMVLEDSCSNLFQDSISIKFGDIVLATGTDANPPVVTKDTLEGAGAPLCDGKLTVEIHRTYPAAGVCNNGDFVQTCETVLNYTDDSNPVFVGHTAARLDTIVACDGDRIAAIMEANKPSAQDNCGTPTVTAVASDVDFSDACVMHRTVIITYTATDICNNTATATDTLVIRRPTEFSPSVDAELECSDNAPDALVGAPRLYVGDFKNGSIVRNDNLDSLQVTTTTYKAGYILTFSDEVIDANACDKKVYRSWSYDDWCNTAGPQGLGTQFIYYEDKQAPTFDDYTIDTTFDLDFGTCTKSISLPLPTATDLCGSATVKMIKVERLKADGTVDSLVAATLGEANPLECGKYRITWEATDGCVAEKPTLSRDIELQDTEDPVVTCEDEVFVSVSNSAGVVMEASTFYKTATDNCGTPTVRIRRQLQEENGGGFGPWGTSILVECNALVRDVNHNSFNVEVEVTDKNGRKNTCWVKVTPEDKIAPICNDIPDDLTRTCDEFHNGELGKSTDTDNDGVMDADEWVVLDKSDAELDALRKLLNAEFGTPVCTDNLDECGAIEITQSYQLIEEGCGVIRVKRKWSATDWGAQGGVNTSQEQEQSIRIEYKQDWKLTFPKDATLTCGEDGIPAPASFEDIVTSGACDNFLLNVSEETFATPGETCMKLIRTYELINWCVYDANKPGHVVPHNEDGAMIEDGDVAADQGKFTYSQVIKLDVSDGGILVEQNSADINTCIIGIGDASPFGEEDKGLSDGVYECDTVRTFSATATNCLGLPLTRFSYRVTVDGVTISGDGNEVEVNVEPGKTYEVTFVAFDDCNNSNSSTESYTFRDCKRPTPYVLNGIAIELGEGGTVDLWASDLDEGSYDNCTDQKDLEMYISKERVDAVSADNATNLAAIRAAGTSLTLGCDDVGTRVVYIYVVDASGNWDVVETFVLVESNIFDCVGANEGGMVAGHIVNPNGENVEQVSVSISGGMQDATTTGTDGAFQFNVTTGADYTVTPVKDMNPLNGVSTFDLVLISKHILGITAFDSPYKHIAADVNKSGTITAFDMVQLRKLILNINTEFSNNDSWRFVDADHDFSLATVGPAAQDFAEFKNISQLATNMMNLDFVGVKIGDVNGSASANSLLGAESRTTNGTLDFNVTDRLVEAGETVTVDFTSADIAAAQGYQFTMNFAGLDLTKLEEGVAKAANFNTNLVERGLLTTSWNGQATANDVLFSLTFNATSTGLLSELITLSSDLTTAEAYNTDGELLDVNIKFTSVDVDFALAQNVPNPFNGETVVSFNLPTAGVATLKVMDAQGKVLKEIRGDYAKGNNAVVLKAKELTTGVLYYQLESADQIATKKMIIID